MRRSTSSMTGRIELELSTMKMMSMGRETLSGLPSTLPHESPPVVMGM
jgi:hypothetical protein